MGPVSLGLVSWTKREIGLGAFIKKAPSPISFFGKLFFLSTSDLNHTKRQTLIAMIAPLAQLHRLLSTLSSLLTKNPDLNRYIDVQYIERACCDVASSDPIRKSGGQKRIERLDIFLAIEEFTFDEESLKKLNAYYQGELVNVRRFEDAYRQLQLNSHNTQVCNTRLLRLVVLRGIIATGYHDGDKWMSRGCELFCLNLGQSIGEEVSQAVIRVIVDNTVILLRLGNCLKNRYHPDEGQSCLTAEDFTSVLPAELTDGKLLDFRYKLEEVANCLMQRGIGRFAHQMKTEVPGFVEMFCAESDIKIRASPEQLRGGLQALTTGKQKRPRNEKQMKGHRRKPKEKNPGGGTVILKATSYQPQNLKSKGGVVKRVRKRTQRRQEFNSAVNIPPLERLEYQDDNVEPEDKGYASSMMAQMQAAAPMQPNDTPASASQPHGDRPASSCESAAKPTVAATTTNLQLSEIGPVNGQTVFEGQSSLHLSSGIETASSQTIASQCSGPAEHESSSLMGSQLRSRPGVTTLAYNLQSHQSKFSQNGKGLGTPGFWNEHNSGLHPVGQGLQENEAPLLCEHSWSLVGDPKLLCDDEWLFGSPLPQPPPQGTINPNDLHSIY